MHEKIFWNTRRGKKGFTLVELLVVLVVLAIMAAILVPSLTGYIRTAKREKYVNGSTGRNGRAVRIRSGSYD